MRTWSSSFVTARGKVSVTWAGWLSPPLSSLPIITWRSLVVRERTGDGLVASYSQRKYLGRSCQKGPRLQNQGGCTQNPPRTLYGWHPSIQWWINRGTCTEAVILRNMQCLGRSEIFAMKNGMSPDRRQEAAQKPSVSHQVTHLMTAATAPSKRSSSKLSLTKDIGMVDMRVAGFSLKWPTVWWSFFFFSSSSSYGWFIMFTHPR